MAVLERVAVDGLAQGAVPPGYTHTRSTAGLYIDSDGLLKVAAINTPRRQWDATNRRWGYVGEPGRTNLLLQSILPGGGAAPTSWTQDVGTGSSAPAASIYGSVDGAVAYAFSATAQRPMIGQSPTLAANTTYAYSARVEAVSGVNFDDVISVTGLPAGAAYVQRYINGVAVAAFASIAAGDLLCIVIGGTYLSGTGRFRLGVGCNGNATGSVTMSRPQLEAGPYLTSYIPTTTVAVSRGADLLTRALTAGEGTALSAQGTMVVEFSFLGGDSTADSGNRGAAYLQGATSSDSVFIYNRSSAVGSLIYQASSNQAAPIVAGTAAAGVIQKAAVTWKLNDVQFARNGSHGTRDTAATMPTLTQVAIGGTLTVPGSVLVYGWTISDDHYPTDAALDALTTPTTNRNQSRLTLGLGLGL